MKMSRQSTEGSRNKDEKESDLNGFELMTLYMQMRWN